MPKYIKIPREIIYNKELGDKRVLLLSYLCSRRSLDDTVAFSINELCEWTKNKPNSHEGKINQKILDTLSMISGYGYFEQYPDFHMIFTEKGNSPRYYKISLNETKFDCESNFGVIYLYEIDKILNFSEELKDSEIDLSRIYPSYIFLVLSYLRINIYSGTDKPLCCYRHYKTMADDIGISERYVSRCIEILDALDIIRYSEVKRRKYEDAENKTHFITGVKIFANYKNYIRDDYGFLVLDEKYNYENELEKQIDIFSKTTKNKANI